MFEVVIGARGGNRARDLVPPTLLEAIRAVPPGFLEACWGNRPQDFVPPTLLKEDLGEQKMQLSWNGGMGLKGTPKTSLSEGPDGQ